MQRKIDGKGTVGDACRVRIEKHVEIVSPDVSAVDTLSEAAELAKASIKQAMTKGAVWIGRGSYTQRLRRAGKRLEPGDSLHLYFDETILGQQPADAILIKDEGSYSIWFKPYGMLCQGSKWGDHCTINRWVEQHLEPQRPAFITHRLDRAATGLIIIAHRKTVAAYFAEQFRQRAVEKRYRAIVHGRFPDSKTIDTPIGQKTARSHAKLISYDTAREESLLEVEIETGRKHQIRRHLAEAGFPIVGDRLYGGSADQAGRDLCLTSWHLSFNSPEDGTRKTYTLPRTLGATSDELRTSNGGSVG